MMQDSMFYRTVLSLSACISGLIAVAEIASSAEITVMSDTPVAAALNPIAEVFHQRTGNDVRFVFGRLGVSNAVKDKVVRASPPEVVARVLQGKGSEIGVMVVTLIKADKRLQLIGTLPAEFQSYLVYTAVPLVSARSPQTTREFIDFLSSPQAKKEFIASGGE